MASSFLDDLFLISCLFCSLILGAVARRISTRGGSSRQRRKQVRRYRGAGLRRNTPVRAARATIFLTRRLALRKSQRTQTRRARRTLSVPAFCRKNKRRDKTQNQKENIKKKESHTHPTNAEELLHVWFLFANQPRHSKHRKKSSYEFAHSILCVCPI